MVCCWLQWCLRPALWCVADCSVVFTACFADCSVVFTACFVACCWLFSGVYGPLCGVLLTVQWCSWPALWRVAVQWCLQPALWCVADCSVVFTACFVACCWLFSGVYGLLCGALLFSGVYGLFVVCCWLFSGVHGLLCGVLLTVQWCLRPALWRVADCSVVVTARFVACCWLFSGGYGLLCGMLLTVQWCLWPALWHVADCSVVFTACFVVCCWLFSLFTARFADCSVVFTACFVVCCWLFSGVHGLLCGVLQRPVRVRVLRNKQMLAVSLTPGPWSGRGNLGWVHHSQCWSPCRHCAAETEWRTQHSNRVTWGHWVNSDLVIHSLKVLFILLKQIYAPAGQGFSEMGGGGGGVQKYPFWRNYLCSQTWDDGASSKSECHAERLFYYLQCQGHSEG